MPKLSIIVPTFNSGPHLQRCLESIGVQTFRDWEIILQDGGSSDDTVRIAERFRTVNPGVDLKLFTEKDKGPYDAMNKGVRRATGEWFYFLGSDDELHDETVLAAVTGSPSLRSSNALYGNVQVVGDAGWANDDSLYDGMFDLKKLLNRNICHQAIFYRATFLRRIGEYNTRYIVCADWDFNLRCWSKTEFRYVDVTVANFHAGGLSHGGPDQAFRQELARNVLNYFNLSIYDPLINRPEFAGFADIIKMQQSKSSFGNVARRIRRIVEPCIRRLGLARKGSSSTAVPRA